MSDDTPRRRLRLIVGLLTAALAAAVLSAGSSWAGPAAAGRPATRPDPTTARAVGVAPAQPVSPAAPAGSAALFVGVNGFTVDGGLRPLQFAVDDAVSQAHVFVVELKLVPAANCYLALSGDPGGADAKAQLAVLEKAGAHRITALKANLLQSLAVLASIPADRADLLVVSFSTHGFEDAGVPYALPADGVRAFLADTGVNLASVERRLAASKAGKRLLLVDACREKASADAKGGDPLMSDPFRKALAAAEGQAVLASCDVGQLSYEDPAAGHGVFTAYLLEGLRGKARADDRGFITLGAVGEYVADGVSGWVARNKPGLDRPAAQRPWFKGPRDADRIPLAVDPARQAELAKAAEAARVEWQKRATALKELFTADQITPEQYQEARRLLQATPESLDDAGRARRRVYADLVGGGLKPEYLKAALDSLKPIQPPKPSASDRVALLLATARANDSRAKAKEAMKALDELFKLDPKNADGLKLRKKVADYFAADWRDYWLGQAAEAAGRVTDIEKKAQAYYDIAKVQAAAGDASGARTTADRITNDLWRAWAYAGIAVAQAVAGDAAGAGQSVRAALAAADRLTDDSLKASAYADIAKAQAAGDAAGAGRSFVAALTAAGRIADDSRKAWVYSDIAEAQAAAGDAAEARATADRIASDHLKAVAYERIIGAQAAAGDAAGAKATANRITDEWRKASVYAGIAKAQAAAGDAAGARQTIRAALDAADRITNDAHKADAYAGIAKAQSAAGDAAGARQTIRAALDAADRLPDQLIWKMSDYAAIAGAQAAAGDPVGAKATVDRITGDFTDGTKASAYADIAKAQAAAEDLAGARATADQITIDHLQASAYLAIAAAWSRSGDWQGVEDWTKGMTNPGLRAAVLRGAAEGLLPGKPKSK